MSKTYVHVVAGPYHLLLDAVGVKEVFESAEAEGGKVDAAGSYRQWRGQAVPVVYGRNLLGVYDMKEDEDESSIVYAREDEQPVIFAVDRVEGLMQLDDGDFSALPPMPSTVTGLFDAIYMDGKTGIGCYRCRDDLNLADATGGGYY